MNAKKLTLDLAYIRTSSLDDFASDFRDWATQALIYIEELEEKIDPETELREIKDDFIDLDNKQSELQDDLVEINKKLDKIEVCLDEDVESPDSEMLEEILNQINSLKRELDEIPANEDVIAYVDRIDGLEHLIEKRYLTASERMEGIEWAIRDDNSVIIKSLKDARDAIKKLVNTVKKLKADVKKIKEKDTA